MQRLIEGTPGQEAEVWVQDRGGGPLRLRGTLVIEDLSDVLTEISSRTGANGPLNPVTQFMLSEASNHLAERLSGNDHAKNARAGHVPRLLSTASIKLIQPINSSGCDNRRIVQCHSSPRAMAGSATSRK